MDLKWGGKRNEFFFFYKSRKIEAIDLTAILVELARDVDCGRVV